MRKSLFIPVDGPLRKRVRMKRTWIKVVGIDLKKCNLFADLAQDRLEWQNRIADPNIVGGLGARP